MSETARAGKRAIWNNGTREGRSLAMKYGDASMTVIREGVYLTKRFVELSRDGKPIKSDTYRYGKPREIGRFPPDAVIILG
jgi:hypothetical protein